MNVTMYTLNNWLLYFIYLHKGFMSVIAIIAVQCKLSENGYHVGVMRVIQVVQLKLALNYNRLSSALKHACLVWLTPT